MIIGTAIVAGLSGYMVGIASSLGIIPLPFGGVVSLRKNGMPDYDDEEESAEEDVDEAILDHAPNWRNGFEADKRDGLRSTASAQQVQPEEKSKLLLADDGLEACKLVLVVRTDLGMTKGTSACSG
jgi:PTH2 family peptidyl-tRNA hydrolase